MSAIMNRHHFAVIAIHAPIRNDVLNNNQPVRARVYHCVPVALNGPASRWPAVVVYWLVKIGWIATLARMVDSSRLGGIEPVNLIVVLFNHGRGGTLHIKKLFDGRSHPAIHCWCM